MQKYAVNQHLIETLLSWVKSGEIAIPEIQCPFVWDSVNNVFPALMPMDEFKLLDNTTQCYYCEITTAQIVELGNKGKLRKKNLRDWSLEIDRKNPNLEYFVDNCVMACYWCNNAKADEFTAEEFKEIAKGIKKVWSNRLSK